MSNLNPLALKQLQRSNSQGGSNPPTGSRENPKSILTNQSRNKATTSGLHVRIGSTGDLQGNKNRQPLLPPFAPRSGLAPAGKQRNRVPKNFSTLASEHNYDNKKPFKLDNVQTNVFPMGQRVDLLPNVASTPQAVTNKLQIAPGMNYTPI